uniref:Protein kinase domain-containing protein n=1 Tax=Aureoumbra lagunensis TaxID=44058 RepID=A0A7S3K486_9STRA
MQGMQSLLESLKEERGQTQEDLVAINTALDKVGIEIQNEFIDIKDQLRRGNQNQAAMMQKMEKQEILLQKLLKKDEQRVQQSQKPKVTVLELNSNDIIFGEFIGRGGFGVVYKGTWNGVAVALKTFPSNAVDAKTREDLRKEALKHQRMKNHPNIISFYGVCLEPSDKACLVIEFASGGTLFDRIYKIDIDISTPLALAYAFELVAGLVHLHKNSICHRDLKSLNVLIAAGGILKLSDFGLAKVKSTFSSATSTKSSVGTWAWMAPEQHDDDPKVEIDWEKNDVYSLGMVLFEIVTKKQPWDGLNPTQIIRAVLDKKKRPEIATSDESRHKVLVAILKKCWNQDATQRPSLKNGDIQERIATTLKQLGGDPRQAANVVDISPAVPVSTNSSQKQKPPPPPPPRLTYLRLFLFLLIQVKSKNHHHLLVTFLNHLDRRNLVLFKIFDHPNIYYRVGNGYESLLIMIEV